jgi:hypothetical protein
MLERCPDCRRLSLEYSASRLEYRCLWYACGYVRAASNPVGRRVPEAEAKPRVRRRPKRLASMAGGRAGGPWNGSSGR